MADKIAASVETLAVAVAPALDMHVEDVPSKEHEIIGRLSQEYETSQPAPFDEMFSIIDATSTSLRSIDAELTRRKAAGQLTHVEAAAISIAASKAHFQAVEAAKALSATHKSNTWKD